MRIGIIIISFIVFSRGVVARGFTPVDSVGVKDENGKNYIRYKVGAAETWFRISREYGVTVKELQAVNKYAVSKPLSAGQILLVPVNVSVPSVSHPVIQPGDKPIMHEVKRTETLYSIAVSNGVTMRNIRMWNNLKNDNLSSGQKLIVGYEGKKTEKNKPIAVSVKPASPADEAEQADVKKDSVVLISNHKKEKLKKNLTDTIKSDTLTKQNKDDWKIPAPKGNQIEEHGMATFIEDEDINPHKYYALHRLAPKGTIIKVTNIMNKKQIYVKVIGTLPDTGDNNDLIIKMSKAGAMKLGVLDNHFQVVLDYYGK